MLGNKDEQGGEYKLYPPPKFKTVNTSFYQLFLNQSDCLNSTKHIIKIFIICLTDQEKLWTMSYEYQLFLNQSHYLNSAKQITSKFIICLALFRQSGLERAYKSLYSQFWMLRGIQLVFTSLPFFVTKHIIKVLPWLLEVNTRIYSPSVFTLVFYF